MSRVAWFWIGLLWLGLVLVIFAFTVLGRLPADIAIAANAAGVVVSTLLAIRSWRSLQAMGWKM